MSLADLAVGPVIPVSDLKQSLAFYEGSLGLSGEPVPGGFTCCVAAAARGSSCSPGTDYAAARRMAACQLRGAGGLEAVVDGLHAAGVATEALRGGPVCDRRTGALPTWTACASPGSVTPTEQVIAILGPIERGTQGVPLARAGKVPP